MVFRGLVAMATCALAFGISAAPQDPFITCISWRVSLPPDADPVPPDATPRFGFVHGGGLEGGTVVLDGESRPTKSYGDTLLCVELPGDMAEGNHTMVVTNGAGTSDEVVVEVRQPTLQEIHDALACVIEAVKDAQAVAGVFPTHGGFTSVVAVLDVALGKIPSNPTIADKKIRDAMDLIEVHQADATFETEADSALTQICAALKFRVADCHETFVDDGFNVRSIETLTAVENKNATVDPLEGEETIESGSETFTEGQLSTGNALDVARNAAGSARVLVKEANGTLVYGARLRSPEAINMKTLIENPADEEDPFQPDTLKNPLQIANTSAAGLRLLAGLDPKDRRLDCCHIAEAFGSIELTSRYQLGRPTQNNDRSWIKTEFIVSSVFKGKECGGGNVDDVIGVTKIVSTWEYFRKPNGVLEINGSITTTEPGKNDDEQQPPQTLLDNDDDVAFADVTAVHDLSLLPSVPRRKQFEPNMRHVYIVRLSGKLRAARDNTLFFGASVLIEEPNTYGIRDHDENVDVADEPDDELSISLP